MNILLKILLGVVRLYQGALSPFLPQACRFEPSCSEYMADALKHHGAKGVVLGIKRLCRCHPWGGHGFDPVTRKDDTTHGHA